MTIKNLSNTDFDQIMDCFLAAFENYYVKMPTDRTFYKDSWEQAKVDLRFSYGLFDKEKLVGFIINAVDEKNDDRIAFNKGTGVLPAYRGKKIVKSIYEYALPDLKENGFTKCSLEVITKNTIAIKAYEGIGFQISKKYKCYKGEIKLEEEKEVNLKECVFSDLNWAKLPNQRFYSWDNQHRIIQNGNYKYFQIVADNKVDSYFVINADTGYLAQFEVLYSSQVSWSRLFTGIKKVTDQIRINNIDERLAEKTKFVKSIGLQNTVDQYEMEMGIGL